MPYKQTTTRVISFTYNDNDQYLPLLNNMWQQCYVAQPAFKLDREWSRVETCQKLLLLLLFTVMCFVMNTGWWNCVHCQIWRLDRIFLPHRIFTLGSVWWGWICNPFCCCRWGQHPLHFIAAMTLEAPLILCNFLCFSNDHTLKYRPVFSLETYKH